MLHQYIEESFLGNLKVGLLRLVVNINSDEL